MKRNTLAATLGCAAVLSGALGIGYAARYDTAPMADQGRRQDQRDRHPEMTLALAHLQQAESALDHAARDFHGHRAKALKLTRDAMKEVQKGIDSDTDYRDRNRH